MSDFYINRFTEPTDKKHSDMIDSMAYAISGEMMRLQNEYILVYIKAKPKWLPKFIYKFIIKKILVVTKFK